MRIHKTAWAFLAAWCFLGFAVEVASTASGIGGPAYSHSPQQQWYGEPGQCGQPGQYEEPQQQMQQLEEQQPTHEQEPSSGVDRLEKSPLPPGWTEHLDPASGQSYYYNSADGTTTWDRPLLPDSPEHKKEISSPEDQAAEYSDSSQVYEEPSASPDIRSSEASSEPTGMGQQLNFTDPVASSFQKHEPTKIAGGQHSGQIQQPNAWQSQNPGWGMPSGDSGKVLEKPQQPLAGWGLPVNEQQQPSRQMSQIDTHDPRNLQQQQQQQQQQRVGHQQQLGAQQQQQLGAQQQQPGGHQQPNGQLQQQQPQPQEQYHQSHQQHIGRPHAQAHGTPTGDKPPFSDPQSGSPPHWGLPPPTQSRIQQTLPGPQGAPLQVQDGTPTQAGGNHPGAILPPHLQNQRQNAPAGQGAVQGPPQYHQAGPPQGQKPLGQQRPPQQQQPQQQPPQQGSPQQYNPTGRYNPYAQYGSYGQYAANQYGSYGGQQGAPPRPPGQLVTQPIESTVSQALGGAWQGLLGFGKKTTEVVGQAKETVAAKAAEATQTLSATSTSWLDIAKSSVGSFFEGGSTNDAKRGGYSLSGSQQPPQGLSSPSGNGPPPGYQQLGYPPQGGFPPRGYPPQTGQPQRPQGQRSPPGYPQQQSPRYQPRQDPAYPQPGQPQPRVQQPMQSQWAGAGAQGYPPQQSGYSPQVGYPSRPGQHGQGQQGGPQGQGPQGQQQGGPNNNQASASPWNHPGLATEY